MNIGELREKADDGEYRQETAGYRYGTIFRITVGYQKARTSLLKKISGRIFTVSK